MRDVLYKTNNTGHEFPSLNGELLSWSIGLYFTWGEAAKNYPKARCVIRAMKEKRPDQLQTEMVELTKSSLSDRVFGHSARKLLDVINDELSKK